MVHALNADLPYDRFFMLQIAGDEVSPGDHDALIATGFCRCGPREVVGGNVIPEVKRQSELSEITGTVGSVFLGLTIGCAPLPRPQVRRDPHDRLLPAPVVLRGVGARRTCRSPRRSRARRATRPRKRRSRQKVAPLKTELAALEAPYREALKAAKLTMLSAEERAVAEHAGSKDRTPAQKKLAKGLETSLRITWEEVAAAVAANPADHARREQLKRAIYEIERTLPRPPAHAMALVDEKSKVTDTFVLRRGDYKMHGPKVAPRPPGVILASQPRGCVSRLIDRRQGRQDRPPGGAWRDGWPARTIPLTARVIVNRLWQYHFGRGIVATAERLRRRAASRRRTPSCSTGWRPKLVADGWRLKPIHRLMVTSATYRQSNRPDPKLAADDPENTLFGRMNRRRLDAEGVRDAMLAVSGELNPRMGGPGVLAPLEKEVKDLIFTEAEVVDLWPEDRDPAEHAQALALSLPQTKRALPALRRLRCARYPERLPAPRDQHPRPPGPDALEQRLRGRPGAGPGRRGSCARRGEMATIAFGGPTDRPGPRAEAIRDRASAVVLEGQAERIRTRRHASRTAWRGRSGTSTAPRPRRGSISRWRC